MVPPLLFVLFCHWGESENRALLFALGGALFCMGVLVRIWAQMHLHYRLPVKKILTRTGPYQFTRNPFYIANTIILLGLTVVSGLIWCLPVMLVYCAIVYSLVVRYEEAHLLNKYGSQYKKYLDSVPRWVPRRLQQETQNPPNVMQHLWPSVKAELYNLLYPIPFVAKQLFF